MKHVLLRISCLAVAAVFVGAACSTAVAAASPVTQQPVTSGLVLVRSKPSALPSAMSAKHGMSRAAASSSRFKTVAVKPPHGTSDVQFATELMLDPNVRAVSLDYARQPLAYTSTPNDPYATDTAGRTVSGQWYPYWRSWWYRGLGSDWGTKAARVWPKLAMDGEPYHARSDASAVKVAVLDTGFYMDHADKGSGIVAGMDLCDTISTDTGIITTDYDVTPVPATAPLSSEYNAGHGTCTAGQVGAATNNGTGVASIGFDNQVRVYKVEGVWIEGDAGLGYPAGSAVMFDSVIINAIDQAVADGCKVISMSLGGPDPNPTMQAAINDAHAAGTLVVASTGNDATSTVAFPAAYDNVVGVGAYSLTGGSASVTGVTRSSFSNYGPGLDIMAPGVVVNGLIRPGFDSDGTGSVSTPGYYGSWQGTSMATPIVAGAAAMIWRFVPDMTPDEVAGYLYGTARDMGTVGFDQTNGWGAVDVDAAYTQLIGDYPVMQTPVPAGASPTRLASYPVSWPAVAGSDHYTVSIDGATPTTVAGTSTTVALTGDGAHSIGVRAISAGRRWSSTVGTLTVTLDTVAPVVSTIGFDPAMDRVTFSGEVGASAEGRIDGGAPTPLEGSPWTLPALTEGAHTVEVRQTDAAGNVGGWKSLAIDYNVTPTTPTLDAAYAAPTTPLLVDWPDVPSADGYDVQVDGGVAQRVVASQYALPLSATSKSLSVRAVNGAKTSAWAHATAILVAPDAPVIGTPADASVVHAPWVVAEWSASPGATSYEYMLNGDAPVSVSATGTTVSGLAAGPNSLKVRAVNAAGASAWSPTVAVTFDVPASTSMLALGAPSSVAWGASVPLAGVLSSGGSGIIGEPVTIQRLVGDLWLTAGLATTGSGGAWTFSVPQSVTTAYRATYPGSASYLGSSSSTSTVGQRVLLTRPTLSTSRPIHYKSLTVKTYLTPRHTAGKTWVRFLLQRKQSGKWVTRRTYSASTVTSGSRSLCSKRLSFPYTGTWRVVASYSKTTSYAVTSVAGPSFTVR